MMTASSAPDSPILVTGAAGFIGARFVESCNARGIPVASVDKAEYFATRPEHSKLDFGHELDISEAFAWLERNPVSAIVHMGACSSTTETDVAFLTENNVRYSQRLWEHARLKKIPFVYASSAATYGAGEAGYSDDETQIPKLKPLNAYGQSKQDFDLWALEQERQGSTPPAWSGFKFFNVYGFGERHKEKQASVVLHAFDQLFAQGSVKLFKSHKNGIADGEQRRDFVYIDDVVDVLRFALSKPIRRGVFNLGSGQARTFVSLARAVFAAAGKGGRIEFVETPENIRDKYQYFTQAEMKKLAAEGYAKPFTKLEDGVARYVRQLLSDKPGH
jgi:ADP-L-glycero-D-manno-heptose 6-epimerase